MHTCCFQFAAVLLLWYMVWHMVGQVLATGMGGPSSTLKLPGCHVAAHEQEQSTYTHVLVHGSPYPHVAITHTTSDCMSTLIGACHGAIRLFACQATCHSRSHGLVCHALSKLKYVSELALTQLGYYYKHCQYILTWWITRQGIVVYAQRDMHRETA